jgi:(p)ppGpp synthase/HD superfamily hydrolase
MNLLRTAIDLAHALHAGQIRRGLPLPYITHPCDVIRRLVHWGIEDYETLAIAALHDVYEECKITPFTLAQKVGQRVASGVESLTYDGPKDNAEVKQMWIDGFATKGDVAVIVKAADCYSNVEDIALGNPIYARVYFDRAHVLFATLFKRQRALNSRYRSLAGSRACVAFAGLDWTLP